MGKQPPGPNVDPYEVSKQVPREKTTVKGLGVMKQGLRIFTYGFTTVFGNFGTALRLTGLVWILFSAAHILLAFIPYNESSPSLVSETVIPILDILLFLLPIFYCVMVWSRYCTGDEVPNGWLPSLKGMPFLKTIWSLVVLYIVSSLLAAAIVLGGFFVIGLVAQVVGLLLSSDGGGFLPGMHVMSADLISPSNSSFTMFPIFFLFGFLGAFVTVYIALRMSPIVAAAAAGSTEKMGIGNSLRHSRKKGLFFTAFLVLLVWVCVAALFVAAVVFPLISDGFAHDALSFALPRPITPLISQWHLDLINIVVIWLFMMMTTSWMAAIYRAGLDEAGAGAK